MDIHINTRKIASYLVNEQDKFIHLLDDQGFYIDEDSLSEVLQAYFNSIGEQNI